MLDAGGNAEFPSHSLAAGTHIISANYWGDNSYNASTSASVTFTVEKAGTSTSVTSSVNSISSGTVTITAAVRPSSAGSFAQFPNGTVTFTNKVNGAVLGTSGGLTLVRDAATGEYFSTGSADVPVSELTPGNNSIVATYNGDTNFAASAASAPVVVACTAGCGNGTGQALALSFTRSTPATATNPAGTPSTAVVFVMPAGGFTGAVNLTCSVTGTHSNDVNIPTCRFSPATVTITNTLSVQSTLTVTTTAGGTTAASDASAGHLWPAARGGAMLACLLCFGIRGRRRALTMLSILVCGFALGGMVACGGTGSSASAPATSGNAATGTTPDAYTVTFRAVDAATGTLTAQDSFTISVN